MVASSPLEPPRSRSESGGSAPSGDSGLLNRLSEVATRVQKARCVADVMESVGAGLLALGIRTIFAEVTPTLIVTRYVAVKDAMYAAMDEAYQRSAHERGGPMMQGDRIRAALRDNQTTFINDLPRVVEEFFSKWGQDPIGITRLMRASGYGRAILCPLQILDRPWGAMYLFSDEFCEQDLTAFRLFGAHVSCALEVSQAIESLESTNRQLSAIHELAKAGTEVELGVLMPRMLETTTQVAVCDYAAIYLLNSSSTGLDLVGVSGAAAPEPHSQSLPISGDVKAQLENPRFDRAMPLHQWPLANGDELMTAGIKQMALLGLIIQGKLAGILSLGRIADLRFSLEDVLGAQLVADQIAVQLDRVRLYSAERRRAEDLSAINEMGAAVTQHLDLDRLVQVGVAQAARVANVPHAFVLLLEPDNETLRVVASNLRSPDAVGQILPPTVPSLGRTCIDRGKPQVEYGIAEGNKRVAIGLASRFGHKSVLAVPLVTRGGPVGAMVLGETLADRRFSDAEIDRAQAVGHHLAVAIANARLYEAERQRVEELNLLLDVGRVITGSLDLDQILQASVGNLARMIQASDAFIWLYDAETRRLRGGATTAVEHLDHFQSVQIPISEPSAAGRAILTRSPVRLDDTRTSGVIHQVLNERYGMQSLLALPLVVRDVAIGAVAFGDRNRARSWSDSEVERATVMCRQVAIAIANARLFEDLRRSYDTLARTQEELVKRERLAALGELAAVVAHEVRNPLGVIFNSLVSLKKTLATDASRAPPRSNQDTPVLLEMMSEEADRLNRIVGDLLDFARPNPPDMRPEPLDQVINGACDATRSQTTAVEIHVENDPRLPSVPLDARMLRQALVNLLMNSIQAMPRGGEVTVRTRLEKMRTRSWATVEVSDNGPGIPRATAERIFQPFFTTKATGTGLGLAVVKRIVETHRGEIGVSSVEGRGTTFTLRLPLDS